MADERETVARSALERVRARAARDALVNAQTARRLRMARAGSTSYLAVEYHGPEADETGKDV